MKSFFKLNKKIITNTFIKHQLKRFSIIGIDLGGTNSYAAIQEPSGPRIIENAEGKFI